MRRGKRQSQILIVDGNLLFRRGLRTLLSSEADLEVTQEASDPEEALAKINASHFDVVVMDLALVTGDGRQATFEIRKARPEIALFYLTQEDGPEQLETAIATGACAYMLKGSTAVQLLAGIRQIAFSDDQNARGLSKVIPDLKALAVSNNGYTRGTVLTSREQEVIKLLAEGRTVREVASELSLSVKTVEAHKLNLMRKLDIHNRASLVEYAVQRGLVGQLVL